METTSFCDNDTPIRVKEDDFGDTVLEQVLGQNPCVKILLSGERLITFSLSQVCVANKLG